jgi:hypothetical protein
MVISPELQVALDAIIKVALSVLVPLLIAWFQAFASARLNELRSNIAADKLAQLDFWASLVVKAIEQSTLKEHLLLTADDKLNMAVDMLQLRANTLGLKGLQFEEYATIIRAKLRDGFHKTDVS